MTNQIAPALIAGLEILISVSRRSGRTSAMMNGLRGGERVVALNEESANYLRRMAKTRRLDIDVVVVNPATISRLAETAARECSSPLVIDHYWIEEYYRGAIWRATDNLNALTSADQKRPSELSQLEPLRYFQEATKSWRDIAKS